jgi:hypothetical protein
MNKKFIVLVYKLKEKKKISNRTDTEGKKHNRNRGLRENKKEKTKVAV